MKTSYTFLLSLILLSSSCKKEANQLKLLPPATQTGANRLGCLVNGKAFVPENQSLIKGPALKCEYGHYAQGYIFYIDAGATPGDGSSNYLSIATDSLQISQGVTLPLTKALTPGMASATYSVSPHYDVLSTDYNTDANATGQLTITHFDPERLIVSGTFQFKAVSKNGDAVNITDGRFDLHYTP